jgi:multicomponent Na+:H+ antiporter subunit D
MLAPVVGLLVGSLLVGITGFGHWAGRAASQFIDRTGYVDAALTGVRGTSPPSVAGVHWTITGTSLGVVSALLAVALAAAGLYGDRVPSAVRVVASPGRAALGLLHRLHSGHVGDYIAWLLVGVAAMAAVVGLPLR